MNKQTDYVAFWLIFATITLGAILIFFDGSTHRPDYYAYANTLDLAEIIDTNKLTIEALEHRNGKLIIEKCIGVVEDAATGKGYVLENPDFYISYKSVNGIKNGNIICTYFIYNPDTNEIDDIISRFDYIIDKGNILE